MSWEKDLKDWAHQERNASAPTPAEAAQLVARASRPSFRWLTLITPVLTAAAVLVVFWAAPEPSPDPAALGVAVTEQEPEPIQQTTLAEGQVTIEGDVFTLAANSIATRAQMGPATRVQLDAGIIEVKAAKRSQGETLTIAAGDYRVQVVGTQFSVQADPFEVNVTEGQVAVRDMSGGEWMLTAGHSFRQGKHIREKHIREKHIREKHIRERDLPGVAALRTKVLDGQYDEARIGLNERLGASEREIASWTLLAQLESRAGRLEEGLLAWDAVINYGTTTEAQRGRYEAARLLEDQPERAIPYLEAFVAIPDPLASDGRLRLANALLAVGKPSQAIEQLERILNEYPGTGAAKKAKKTLNTLSK